MHESRAADLPAPEGSSAAAARGAPLDADAHFRHLPCADKAEEVKPQHDASDKDSKEESKEDVESARQKLEGNSRSVQAGFRHTSGLRVGVIEVCYTPWAWQCTECR
jgi:hypothetical protein